MPISTTAGFERSFEDALGMAEAVRLRSKGLTYREIAEVLNINPSSAYRRVSKALAEVPVEAVDELRRIENERLDKLQAALWDAALLGNVSAVKAILVIMVRRAHLCGLDVPTQLTIDRIPLEVISAEIERLTRILDAE